MTEQQAQAVAEKLGFDRSRATVFVHISGPLETRMPMMRLALVAAKILEGKVQFVFSEGRPNGSAEPLKIGHSAWYYEWCPVRDEIFTLSDAVLMRGGHTALSQAIQFGKPVVTIPIENHGEQLGNSQKIAELGLGTTVHPKKVRPEQIVQAIEQVLGDPSYLQKTLQIKAMTEKLDGIDNVVKIVRSYM